MSKASVAARKQTEAATTAEDTKHVSFQQQQQQQHQKQAPKDDTSHRTSATTSSGTAEIKNSNSSTPNPLLKKKKASAAVAPTAVVSAAAISLNGNQDWEITWPIWHMLPRHERKELAVQHGYKTIGEFEEYMILQRAVGDTTTIIDSENITATAAYPNEWMYNERNKTSRTTANEKLLDRKPSATTSDDGEESDNDEETEKETEMENERLAALAVDGNLSNEDLYKVGGKILMLPDDMLHRIFEWLPVDTYATLALVSPHWKSFTRTEVVYKRLCERLYLQQSKRKALHVNKFNNSYRTMLEQRPRVRAGAGVYVMKYSQIKKIQRDMWTEIPHGAILESVYYRYLYFQEDGRVLYALTPSPPHEMFVRFRRVCLDPTYHDAAAVWGQYSVQKCNVVVTAKQSWQYVQLEMTIHPDILLHGRFGYMSFDKHMTSTSGDFSDWSHDRIVFEVPNEPFRFVRSKRL